MFRSRSSTEYYENTEIKFRTFSDVSGYSDVFIDDDVYDLADDVIDEMGDTTNNDNHAMKDVDGDVAANGDDVNTNNTAGTEEGVVDSLEVEDSVWTREIEEYNKVEPLEQEQRNDSIQKGLEGR